VPGQYLKLGHNCFPPHHFLLFVNPSVWNDGHCSSQGKHHLSWNDGHCSSCCTLSLIRLYLDDIGSKCNRAASCLFVKELALLWCGRQLLDIISSFFSLLPKIGFSLNDDHCLSCCTLSLIRLYLDDIVSKCNWAASYLFMKELALFRCGRQLLEIISSFFFCSRILGILFAVPNFTDGFMRPSNSEMK